MSDMRFHPFHEADHVLFRNHPAVCLYPLAEIPQVRRGVQPGFVSRLAQHGVKHLRYGAFAVGACHVDGAIGPVRMAEQFVQGDGILQPFLVSSAADVLEHRRGVVEVFDGFLISHSANK